MQGLECRVQGLGSRVEDLGCRVGCLDRLKALRLTEKKKGFEF